MLFLGKTIDQQFWIGIDSTIPRQPASIIMQARSLADPIVLTTYPDAEDAEIGAVLFLNCYNAAIQNGFRLRTDAGGFIFQRADGGALLLEQALGDKTPKEFLGQHFT